MKVPVKRDRQRIAADHRQRQPGIEQPRQVQLLEQPGEDAFLGEDQLPGVDLDQIARPQRQHDAEIEQRLPFAARIARRVVGDREGDDRRGERDHRRHRHGADDDVEVRRPQQLAIGLERELAVDQAGELVDREEALQQQREQRAEIDDAEPQHRRRSIRKTQQLRLAPEVVATARRAAAAVAAGWRRRWPAQRRVIRRPPSDAGVLGRSRCGRSRPRPAASSAGGHQRVDALCRRDRCRAASSAPR